MTPVAPLAMGFNHGSLLVWLLIVPVVAGLYWLAQRRRRRYPVRFTALSFALCCEQGGVGGRANLYAALMLF